MPSCALDCSLPKKSLYNAFSLICRLILRYRKLGRNLGMRLAYVHAIIATRSIPSSRIGLHITVATIGMEMC